MAERRKVIITCAATGSIYADDLTGRRDIVLIARSRERASARPMNDVEYGEPLCVTRPGAASTIALVFAMNR
jgi:hypothetical protein